MHSRPSVCWSMVKGAPTLVTSVCAQSRSSAVRAVQGTDWSVLASAVTRMLTVSPRMMGPMSPSPVLVSSMMRPSSVLGDACVDTIEGEGLAASGLRTVVMWILVS